MENLYVERLTQGPAAESLSTKTIVIFKFQDLSSKELTPCVKQQKESS